MAEGRRHRLNIVLGRSENRLLIFAQATFVLPEDMTWIYLNEQGVAREKCYGRGRPLVRSADSWTLRPRRSAPRMLSVTQSFSQKAYVIEQMDVLA